MEKNYRFEYRETNKIQSLGNSVGIPIPRNVLNEIGIEKGEELHIYVNKDLKSIMLFRPKDFAHKEWKEASFELSLPKELAEELLNE